ncbi:MAG: hypothetical protein ACT6S0_00715 [Roseateles sp.]|uniref:hypothetical protein n=1 Tax=Roseateles sp. TaxID=1971397 RepID=UPI00403508AE
MQRKFISRSDVKPRSGVLKLKKRHVEEATCLPTKGMATACWAFIVVKRPGRETAPALVSGSLQAANKHFNHRLSTRSCGSPVDQIQSRLDGGNSIVQQPFLGVSGADFSDWRKQSGVDGSS